MGLSVAAMGALVPLTKYYAWMIDNINIGKVWYLFSILPIALMVSNIYIIPISYANIRVGKVYAKGFIITIFELALYLIVFILFYIFSKTTIEKTKLTERNNILENAIDGCCTVEEGKRYFNLTSEIKGDCLYIVSTNNYGKPLEMDGETYSSTKHQGKGIGLHSMKSITEVYDGIFDAGNNNSEFFVDIMLKY